MDSESLRQVFGISFVLVRDNYKARCPFHDERTPSFYVHQYENVCHCFGCGISGSVDSLGAKASGRSESQIREILGITPGTTISNERRRRLPTIRKEIPESWLAQFKKEVHKYVIHRGFDPSVIAASGSRYDPALKRQVFPHYDGDGQFLGVTGRSCRGEDPKWFHYWDYDKGQALYSPVNGGKSVGEFPDGLILVEGVFDALWIRQHTNYAVAATLGTSVTSAQIAQIRRSTNRVVIGFDNDDAGRKTTSDVYRALRNGGPSIEFVCWPQHAKDWMDLSKEQIDEMLGNTVNDVQRQLIQNTSRSRRIPSEQKESITGVGAGNGQNRYITCDRGTIILPGKG